MSNLSNVLSGIAQNDFVVVGRVGIDFTPPAGVAIEDAENCMVAMGGSSANIAAGICKLGGKASLVTCVSDDAIGKYCINQLKRYGVNSNHVRAVGGEFRNSLAFYETRLEGHQSIIYLNWPKKPAFRSYLTWITVLTHGRQQRSQKRSCQRRERCQM
jgi:5-dehydro-2-deoxygluconokinase